MPRKRFTIGGALAVCLAAGVLGLPTSAALAAPGSTLEPFPRDHTQYFASETFDQPGANTRNELRRPTVDASGAWAFPSLAPLLIEDHRTVNGMGFNPLDGYLYLGASPVDDTEDFRIVRVGTDGSSEDTGIRIPSGTRDGNFIAVVHSADVDADGNFWAGVHDFAGREHLYKIELDADPAQAVVGHWELAEGRGAADFVWSDGALYTLQRGSAADPDYYLARFDFSTSGWRKANEEPYLPEAFAPSAFNVAWKMGNGNLMFGSTAASTLKYVQIDPEVRAQIVGAGSMFQAYGADGASFIAPAQDIDLGVTIAADSEFRPGRVGNYTITVTNHSTRDSTGALLRAFLPEGFVLASATLDGDELAVLHDEDSSGAPIDFLTLPALGAAESRTVRVQAKLPDVEGCGFANAVEIVGNELDSNDSNNRSEIEQCLETADEGGASATTGADGQDDAKAPPLADADADAATRATAQAGAAADGTSAASSGPGASGRADAGAAGSTASASAKSSGAGALAETGSGGAAQAAGLISILLLAGGGAVIAARAVVRRSNRAGTQQ